MNEQLGHIPQWQQPTDTHPELNKGELHLWSLPLTLKPDQQQTALALLSDIQRDKYHRRRTDALKHTYLAGRYYLLNLLGQYTHTPAQDVLLSYSRLNKPSLSDDQLDIEFNFTDTRSNDSSHGLFAFCKGRSVGVDIENIGRKNNFAAIAKDRFTEQELDYVFQESDEINVGRFLAIWTRKEAYGKATGKGINFQMNKVNLVKSGGFEFCIPTLEHRNEGESTNEQWQLKQIELDNGLIGCVVAQGHQQLHFKAFNSADHIV